jgi:tetratricopeptide (TPR) repeat protein
MNKCVTLLACLLIGYPLCAQRQLDSLRNVFQRATEVKKAEAAIAIARTYLNVNIDSSKWYAQKALSLAEQIDDDKLLAESYLFEGNISIITSAYTEGLDYLLKAVELIKQQEPADTVMLLRAYTNIGILYERESDLENAYQYSDKAIKLMGANKNPKLAVMAGSVYNSVANTLFKMKDTTRGIEYLQMGLNKAQRVGNYSQSAILLNNLGNVFLSQHDYKTAYPYIVQSKKIRERIHDQRGLSSSYRNLSNYFKETKQFDSARFYAHKTIGSLKMVKGTVEIYADIYSILSDIYSGLRKYDSALSAYQMHMLYKDSVLSSEKFKELARVEAKHEVLQRTALERAHARIVRLRIIFIISALLAALIILFLLYSVQKGKAKLREEMLLVDQTNLKLELEYKNKDLATQGLYLVKKDEYIGDVIEKLTELKNTLPVESHKTIIKAARDLNSVLTAGNNSWREFELRFKEVHQDFFEELDLTYPDLTSNERRLCAFLKLEMSTKEISSITSQSPRSLEVARSRLRKKLNLTNSETTLSDFLARVGK